MLRKDRVSMDRQAQILVMHSNGHSLRRIAQALKMCKKSVRKYIRRQEKKEEKGEEKNTSVLQEDNPDGREVITQFPLWLQELDWRKLVEERNCGVSFKILYNEVHDKQVSYWSFWKSLKQLCETLHPKKPQTTMRLQHKPGEKVFVDYADGIPIKDKVTGQIRKTWLFVGTLPFSSKVFAEFVFDQKLPSFIGSHERMWQFFGGTAQYTVSDNLKSCVSKAHRYEPEVNKVFCDYANHAGFAVLPARPRRPKDKANVECHVGVLQDSFFQEVRHHSFKSLGEQNQALKQHLEKLNNAKMKDYGVSRNERFEVEKPHLRPLVQEEFVLSEIREASVHPDCHIQFGKCFYSVPWQYVGKRVRVVATTQRLEVFDLFSFERIALHSRGKAPGSRMTEELHWPPEKKEHCDFSVERAQEQGAKVGPETAALFEVMFSQKHPLVYLRRVQGWLRQVSQGKWTRQAMEYASSLALQYNNWTSKYIKSCVELFDHKQSQVPSPREAPKRDNSFIHLQHQHPSQKQQQNQGENTCTV